MTNEVIRTDCATLGAKIDWFNGAVARAVDEHGTLTVDRCDAKTVEELLTMIDLSVSCDVVDNITATNPESKLVIMTNIDTSVSDIVTMIEYDNALVSIVVPMINPMMIQTVPIMSLHNTIIANLRKYANIPVFIEHRESTDTDSILISSIQLDECVEMYSTIHAFVHTVWKNLNGPPDCEWAFVVIWMMASEGLRTVIDPSSAAWLLGTRGPIEYAETMNMPGTADVYLYPKEQIAVPHVDVFCSNKD
ncbi:hypothetical protein UCREL1_4672 [Eutypa lata UCREL1]|uniref:Uncharacterized protein n=1 Tax=Eutypa lata (strain UCR-EL1) TaxID=1287681 RepID=M7TEG1_EUTLA|nr:hypothetical protein UCREL1_4672 [Eutypa lata UCREL1]